jgi:hypothetical protein
MAGEATARRARAGRAHSGGRSALFQVVCRILLIAAAGVIRADFKTPADRWHVPRFRSPASSARGALLVLGMALASQSNPAAS